MSLKKSHRKITPHNETKAIKNETIKSIIAKSLHSLNQVIGIRQSPAVGIELTRFSPNVVQISKHSKQVVSFMLKSYSTAHSFTPLKL